MNNLAPVFCNIDWNRFKQRSKRAETLIQTATESLKRRIGYVLDPYTQTMSTSTCVTCDPDDIFSGFNTARKAAWLTRKS